MVVSQLLTNHAHSTQVLPSPSQAQLHGNEIADGVDAALAADAWHFSSL
jgi:hypothetical protein